MRKLKLLWPEDNLNHKSLWSLSILVGLAASLGGCSGGLLGRGSAADSSGQGPVPIATPMPVATPSPTPVPVPVVPAPTCQSTQQKVGANVVFLIDNSSSTNATDCPTPTLISNVNGSPAYRCGAQTNREKAVLGAFDALTSVAVADTQDLAVSNIAVVQFPTPENTADGSRMMTNGWLRTNVGQTDRPALESAMAFTRTPFGASAFGSSIAAASSLYAAVPADGRARVVVLVTDGEPTDRNPADTNAKAAQLRQLGVQVFTVYVTNGVSRSQRMATHAQMLNSWERTAIQRGLHWYAANYANFNAYIADLLGSANQPSLAQNVASPVDAACVDKPGALCQRFVVEAANSSALAGIVQQIVTSKVTTCP